MRQRIISEIGEVSHRKFLVYLMGPYKAFDTQQNIDQLLEAKRIDPATAFEILRYQHAGETEPENRALDLLIEVRDRLRIQSGVNAFLAIDIDIPVEEIDPATQSIKFALSSNAVIYIVPIGGKNLGVGIEVGSVLEHLSNRETHVGHPMDRILFVHESGVTSAMIEAIHDRWDARVYSYQNRSNLVDKIRLFLRDIARKEQSGDLPTLE